MHLLGLFIQINLAVGIGFGITRFLSGLNKENSFSRTIELKINYLLLALCLLIPLASIFAPKIQLPKPVFQVWSRPTMHFDANAAETIMQRSALSIAGFPAVKQFSETDNVHVFVWFLMLTALVLLLILSRDGLILRRIVSSSFLTRQVGSVSLYISQRCVVPFSFWLPLKSIVVIPSHLLAEREMYGIAVRHELQHHRQGDTRWTLFVYSMNFFCWANPLFYFWRIRLGELQEFACDEFLIGQKKISPHAYSSCLIRVAETALRPQRLPLGATGMAGGSRRFLIKRRINQMFKQDKKRLRGVAWVTGVTSFALIATAILALAGTTQDRRITMAQSEKLAAKASEGTEFPIQVNEQVLIELNRYAGTPDGREFVKKAFERMKAFETMIENKLADYRFPSELKAVPVVESGFQNLPETKNPKQPGAGLWQFIPSAAKKYDLIGVDGHDLRLDPERETDAALRYLGAMYFRFNKDWRLALMAYNMGEDHVQRAKESVKSNDAWKLVKAGFQNDKGYLARVVAVTILMKNPEVLT